MKKLIITIFLIITTALTSCSKEETVKVQKYYKTTTVSTGSVSVGNSYVGYTDSFNVLDLGPKQGGKIIQITKSKGDTVKKGELLVSLDNNEALVGYDTATNVSNTLSSMKTSTAEMFDKQIQALEASIEKAKAQSNGITSSIEDTKNINENNLKTAQAQIEKAEVGLETAKVNLTETQNTLDIKEKQIYDNTKNAITQSVILDTNIIDYIDILVGVTTENKNKNDAFDDYLGAKDRGQLNETIIQFKETYKIFQEYKTLYEEKIENKSPTEEEIKEVSEKGIVLAEELKVLLKDTYDTVDNSIVTTILTQEVIDTHKNNLSNFGEKVEASLLTISGEYLLGLKGSIENLETFESESKLKISLLEKQIEIAKGDLEIAKKTYDNYVAMGGGNLTNVNTQKEISEKTIEELKANIESLKQQKAAKLKEIDTQIKQASGEQKLSGVMINNGKVVSTIDGIVLEKNFEEGEVVGMGTPIIKIASDDEIKVLIQVETSLGEKLKVGDTATIELVEEGQQVKATIKNIYPTKDEITKKIGIELKIDNKDKKIKIGSMVKVYFEETSETGIVIPNKAIISKFMVPGVMEKVGNTAKFKEIKILKQNDNFSLVEGIDLQTEIILEGQENIYDGEILE